MNKNTREALEKLDDTCIKQGLSKGNFHKEIKLARWQEKLVEGVQTRNWTIQQIEELKKEAEILKTQISDKNIL